MDVQLIFINRSASAPGLHLVLFQPNEALNETPVAWRVIPVLEDETPQRFHVSERLSVAVMDAAGNVGEQHLTETGQHWDVVNTKTRDGVTLSGKAESADRVEVRNNLLREPITAQIYKDGRLLAEKSKIFPKQTAAFRFEDTICVGLVSGDIREGEPIPEQLRLITELSLKGFSKADLVLTNTSGEYEIGLFAMAQAAVVHG